MSGREPSAEDVALGIGSSSELRRSVSQATDRIHEIIDAAERVALEIRGDAESDAEAYLAKRKREADEIAETRLREAERAAAGRTRALDQLITTLADSAERFKAQAEDMLSDLDRVVTEARAGVYANGAAQSAGEEPALAPLREVEPDPQPRPAERERPQVVVAPDPGRDAIEDEEAAGREPQAAADQTSEAVLRATQMAVIGKGREEIANSLKADFPGADADSILNEILG